MNAPAEILVRDRRTGRTFVEQVFAEGFLRWSYANPVGRGLREVFFKRRWFSALYGWMKDTRWSRKAIRGFVEQYGIDASEADRPLDAYRTFNEFFSRRFRPGARTWDPDPSVLPAWAEGRVSVTPNLSGRTLLPVKGSAIPLAALLGDVDFAEAFAGGAAVVIRLAPVDYHRFHFPDAGVPRRARRIRGFYQSVSPIALATGRPIHSTNARDVTRFDSEGFGCLAMVEVGALGVGRIRQTFHAGRQAGRGDEKGYFQFGGSTVVVLLQEGRVTLDEDLVEASAHGLETLVRLGERLGRRPPGHADARCHV